jgi:hypothetical protein
MFEKLEWRGNPFTKKTDICEKDVCVRLADGKTSKYFSKM